MIRHRPHGQGHPYRLDADQRVPVQPVAGDRLELRATTDAATVSLFVEVERGGSRTTHAAECVSGAEASKGSTAPGSHLTEASERGETTARIRWRVAIGELRADEQLRYRFRDANGSRTPWHALTVGEWRGGAGTLRVRGAADRLEAESLSWLVAGPRTLRARFDVRLEAHEHVVGFGERFNSLEQRRQAIDSVVFEQYRNQGLRTYMPMPFAIVVGGGWGFHVRTSRRVWFDVGCRRPDRLAVEVDVDPDNPVVELELFDGSPADVLGAFLERTGRPPLPPEWIFTPWMSANEWNTQARVLAEVERSEKERVPVGVVVIEAWSDESTFTAFRDAVYQEHEDGRPHRLADFDFPADGAWPDPKAMVDSLHDRGVRVLLWQIPLLKALPAPTGQLRHDRRALVDRGYAVRQADGRPYSNRGWWFPRAMLPDFSSEATRIWWTEKRRYLIDELGIDGFKTDGGEHPWGADLRYADGSTGADTNNRYPVLYARAFHELFERTGQPAVTFSRAGFTGSAAYPCHWAGDEGSTWEAFRASLTAGLTAGACGVFFWTWDIGGFAGEIPTAELYLRSAAAACFAPIMQYHSEFNHHRTPSGDRTPWNIAERTGDVRALDGYRRFAQLRMRLVRYLFEQAARCIESSKPLMRALFFEVEDDPEIWGFTHQFFCGDDLLVAPVTEPARKEQDVYLPAGDWVDVWTHERISGPCTLRRSVPLDEIPVYVTAVRASELLPLFDLTEAD
jgi:alpha-glucosidase (family GH31 glycosyl hydrolase)